MFPSAPRRRAARWLVRQCVECSRCEIAARRRKQHARARALPSNLVKFAGRSVAEESPQPKLGRHLRLRRVQPPPKNVRERFEREFGGQKRLGHEIIASGSCGGDANIETVQGSQKYHRRFRVLGKRTQLFA